LLSSYSFSVYNFDSKPKPFTR